MSPDFPPRWPRLRLTAHGSQRLQCCFFRSVAQRVVGRQSMECYDIPQSVGSPASFIVLMSTHQRCSWCILDRDVSWSCEFSVPIRFRGVTVRSVKYGHGLPPPLALTRGRPNAVTETTWPSGLEKRHKDRSCRRGSKGRLEAISEAMRERDLSRT